jgi:hypothetical protein
MVKYPLFLTQRKIKMDIIYRKDAKLIGQSTYFTNLPCKNGHVTYRYTQSGTCSACINKSNSKKIDPLHEIIKSAKASLVKIKVRCFEEDRSMMASSAWALAFMHHPELKLGDIDPQNLPVDKNGGTALYSFYCHEDDIGQLRAIASDFLARHSVDIAAARQRIYGAHADAVPPTYPASAYVSKPGDPDYSLVNKKAP